MKSRNMMARRTKVEPMSLERTVVSKHLALAVVLTGVLAQAAFPSVAQGQNCWVVHAISPAPSGYHAVELPAEALAFPEDNDGGVDAEAFRRGVPGYPRSLRVLGKTSAGDTVQVPFVGRVSPGAPAVMSLPQTNVGTVGEATRLTVALPERTLIDRLYLLLGNTDFEGRVLLEAADEPGDWQTLLPAARILDISAGPASYRYTDLRFAAVRFRYYRITISGIDHLRVEDVQAAEASLTDRARQRFAAAVTTMPRVVGTKQTQVLIELPEARLIDRVTVYASADVPFDRPVEVSAVADTILGGDGGLRFRTVASGASVLTRGLIEATTFAEAVTQRLVATIYDGDDQPLRIDSVVVEGPRRFVTARFSSGERFWLAYGCAGLGLPDYDLARQMESIPTGLDTLHVGGAEEVLINAAEGAGWRLGDWALWTVLAVAGVVIVGIGLRLLQS